MGIYRNHFSHISSSLETSRSLEWAQTAPKLDDLLFISSNQTGEAVTTTRGIARLELLGRDLKGLDTPLRAAYSSESLLGGFVINGNIPLKTKDKFNKIQFSDERPFEMQLYIDDEQLEHDISWNVSGLILNGISTVFCDKISINYAREQVDISELTRAV